MPIMTLAVQIWAFCASTSRADEDRWLHPGDDGRRSGHVRGSPGGPWIGTGGAASTSSWTRYAGSAPGDPVDLADLTEGLGLPVGQPEPHGHAGLALGQRAEDGVQLLLQQREADRLAGLDRLGVLYQVAEPAVAVLTERGAISRPRRSPGRRAHSRGSPGCGGCSIPALGPGLRSGPPAPRC